MLFKFLHEKQYTTGLSYFILNLWPKKKKKEGKKNRRQEEKKKQIKGKRLIHVRHIWNKWVLLVSKEKEQRIHHAVYEGKYKSI